MFGLHRPPFPWSAGWMEALDGCPLYRLRPTLTTQRLLYLEFSLFKKQTWGEGGQKLTYSTCPTYALNDPWHPSFQINFGGMKNDYWKALAGHKVVKVSHVGILRGKITQNLTIFYLISSNCHLLKSTP